jgi:integrase-like protein
MAESFFASLECELIDRSRWRTQTEARMAVFDYIECFYNRVAATQRSATSALYSSKGAHSPRPLPSSCHPSTKAGEFQCLDQVIVQESEIALENPVDLA